MYKILGHLLYIYKIHIIISPFPSKENFCDFLFAFLHPKSLLEPLYSAISLQHNDTDTDGTTTNYIILTRPVIALTHAKWLVKEQLAILERLRYDLAQNPV